MRHTLTCTAALMYVAAEAERTLGNLHRHDLTLHLERCASCRDTYAWSMLARLRAEVRARRRARTTH